MKQLPVKDADSVKSDLQRQTQSQPLKMKGVTVFSNNNWKSTLAGLGSAALYGGADYMASGNVITLRGLLGAIAFGILGFFTGGREKNSR